MYVLNFDHKFSLSFLSIYVLSFKKRHKPLKNVNEILDLNEYYRKTHNQVFPPRDNIVEAPIYDLTALILHQGPTTTSGHYTCKLFFYKFFYTLNISN